MSVRAVSFDLDGTLYRARPVRVRFVLAHLFSLADVRVARAVREALRGTEFDDGAAFFEAEARAFAARRDVSIDEARARVDALFGADLVRVLRRVGPAPGAREAIAACRAHGLRVAVISDFRVEEKLAAIGLDDVGWDALVAGEVEGALKPSPRAFTVCCARLGIAPAELVHIGDRADTDLAGARAAGATGVVVPRGGSLLDATHHALRAAGRALGPGPDDARA